MLLKHIEKVQRSSDSYKKIYTLSVSILFTGLIASVWAVSLFSTGFNSVESKANINDVLATVKDVSPASIVKAETGNIWGNFVDSVKSFTGKTLLGDKYGVEFKNGSLGLSPEDNNSKINGVSTVFSTTTSDGITIEAEASDEGEIPLYSESSPIVLSE